MNHRRAPLEDTPKEQQLDANQATAGWSARELADAAGTTIRTIHYYVAEGVLPPPRGERRAAVYPHAHLARLRLIAMLRDEGLSLAAIRARLAALTDAQAEDVAAQMAAVRQAQGDEASLLAHFETALLDVGTDNMRGVDASGRSPAAGGATAYVERLQAARRRDLRPSGPIIPHRPAGAPAPAPAPAPVPAAALTGLSAAEPWHRWPLADGIDLHLRDDRQRVLLQALSDPEHAARLRQALEDLRTALDIPPAESKPTRPISD